MKVGDVVSWGQGESQTLAQVLSIHTKGEIQIPDSGSSLTATEDNPVVLLAPLVQSSSPVTRYLKAATDPSHPSEVDADPAPRKTPATPAKPAKPAAPADPAPQEPSSTVGKGLPPPPAGTTADAMATYFVLLAMAALEAN